MCIGVRSIGLKYLIPGNNIVINISILGDYRLFNVLSDI